MIRLGKPKNRKSGTTEVGRQRQKAKLRPLFVKVKGAKQKWDIIKNAKKLKYTNKEDY